jgi:hypothetical protein
MTRKQPRPIGCSCPPAEFVVTVRAEKGGEEYDFLGAGATVDEAVDDAERHAEDMLGAGVLLGDWKPA